MEASMLFTVAGLRGVRAGALLNVDNYVFERKEYEPHREIVAEGTGRMIRCALRAVPALAQL
jgi:uridine phosphorylase